MKSRDKVYSTDGMRIGILTFFESDNYGTVLQAYALQTFLEQMGHAVTIIHLNRNVHAKYLSKSEYKRVYSVVQRILYKFIHGVHKKDDCKKRKCFAEFRMQYLHTTDKLYTDGSEFVEDIGNYDLIISGGDQIWNPYHKTFSLDYFCAFLPDDFPRISYGSSFGVDCIGEEEILNQIKCCLQKYHSTLIREESGVQMVRELGIEASQVVDPVFLEPSIWNQFCLTQRPFSKSYAIVYALVDYPESDDSIISQYAKDNRLEVVVLPENRRNYLKRYSKAFTLGPEMFLSYIAHSEIVFTNSFHGAAFALLLKKRVVLLNTCTNEAKSKQIRLRDLFHEFDVQNYDISSLAETYSCNYEKIEEEMEQSRNLLKSALSQCEKMFS